MQQPSTYARLHRSRLTEFLSKGHRRTGGRPERFSWFRSEVHRVTARWIDSEGAVLDIGCGDGALMVRCGASQVTGVDADETAIATAARRLPQAEFIADWFEDVTWPSGKTFDTIVLAGVLEQVYDIGDLLRSARQRCNPDSRVVITSYSRLAQPLLRAMEALRLRPRNPAENWIPPSEIHNLLDQAGFEVVQHDRHVLMPFHVPVVTAFVNRWLAPLPVLRQLCLVNVTLARPSRASHGDGDPMVSVVIAARNERENIGPLLDRLPPLSPRQEVVFVEGGSSDGTYERILQEATARRSSGYPYSITALKQPGKGKGDAVRAGFAASQGDILIILDADLSVPPEELPRFVDLLRDGTCDFANGSRLVYPMDDQAMQFLNLIGNRFFGVLFSYLLGQSVRDTLCGTKALWADDYRRIARNRVSFGDFDPFGDFDLLFGAANLGLRIRDVPVHYKERVYGSTNISRFRHGVLLFRMSWIAAKKLRFA